MYNQYKHIIVVKFVKLILDTLITTDQPSFCMPWCIFKLVCADVKNLENRHSFLKQDENKHTHVHVSYQQFYLVPHPVWKYFWKIFQQSMSCIKIDNIHVAYFVDQVITRGSLILLPPDFGTLPGHEDLHNYTTTRLEKNITFSRQEQHFRTSQTGGYRHNCRRHQR